MIETTTARNYGLLTDLDKLAAFVKGVLERDLWVGFDVETGYTGPDREKGSLLIDWDKQFVCGFSISHNANFGRYVPLRHDNAENVNESLAWEIMAPLLTRGKLAIHHEKFERRNVRKMAGIELASDGGEIVDTMLDSYVLSEFALDGALRASNGLKDLSKILFDYDQPHIQTLFPGWSDKRLKTLRFNLLELTPEVVSYCCDDAAFALALLQAIDGRARAERGTMHRIEHEISQIMADVEAKGVGIDWEAMEAALADAHRFVPRIVAAARKGLERLSGKDLSGLNMGSTKQMQELLYKDIGLATTRMTKKPDESKPRWQQMSTDAIAMETLSHKYPEIRKLLDVRETQNMARRLKKWLTEYRYATDGRVHAGYNQVVVGSGRFSASDPAIQQLPKEWRWTTHLDTDCWDDEVWAKVVGGELIEDAVEVDPVITVKPANPPLELEAAAAKDTSLVDETADVSEEGTEDSEEDPDDIIEGELVEDADLALPMHGNGIDYWTGKFRAFIVAAPGYYHLTYDYSQVELRVLAGVTQEPALLKAFNDGIDVHRMTAAMMLHKKPEDVTYKDRQIGKTINFALLYQMGEQSLADRLGITLDEAKALFTKYFAAFTRVGTWQDQAIAKGLRHGYAETPFGRKYTVWELRSGNRAVRKKGERVLVNAPIQGGAADYMKMAMIRVTKKLKELGWWMTDCTIIMNQHDSLTFEVSDRLNPAEVRAIIEPCVVFPVPRFPKIVAEWELGQSWGTAAAWKDGMSPVWDGQHWTLTKPETEPVVEAVQPETGIAETTPPNLGGAPDTAIQDAETVEDALPAHGRVEITVEQPLTRPALTALLHYISEHPGEDETWLVAPVGKFRVGVSGIGKADEPKLHLMLGGATVEVVPGAAMIESLAADLTM